MFGNVRSQVSHLGPRGAARRRSRGLDGGAVRLRAATPRNPGHVDTILPVQTFPMDCGRIELDGGRDSVPEKGVVA